MPFFQATDVASAFGGERQAPKVTNRSLLADKYPEFPADSADKTSRSRTIQKLVESGRDDIKVARFRLQALTSPQIESIRMELGGRMIVNHAGGVIENAGLALDRNSGVPFIPGSTVKGIAREGAHLCGAKAEEVALVFGWADNRNQENDIPDKLPQKAFGGVVAFLPALPDAAVRFERDIVTVHHHEYYAGKRETATDDEQPIPNEFPVVSAGVGFVFSFARIGGERANAMSQLLGLGECDTLARARAWLIAGLTGHGVGSKTAAGYGWFVDPSQAASTKGALAGLTEKEFGALMKLADSRGQWENLKRAIETDLHKPENAKWRAQFLEATAGKDFKELRKKEWYPREG